MYKGGSAPASRASRGLLENDRERAVFFHPDELRCVAGYIIRAVESGDAAPGQGKFGVRLVKCLRDFIL